MKNKLVDLNDHLFAQLERISDEDLTPEQIERECKRTDAVVELADQIIAGADLQFKAAKLVAEHGAKVATNLTLINKDPMVAKPVLVKAVGDDS